MRLLLRSDSVLSYPNSSLIYCSNSSHYVHIFHQISGQDSDGSLSDERLCVCTQCLLAKIQTHQLFSSLHPQIRTLKEYCAGSNFSASCTTLHQHPLPPPFTPAEVQKAGKNKALFPNKTFQNEKGCQFLSNNNFQVQWAVKAQDGLNWAGNNIAEITIK